MRPGLNEGTDSESLRRALDLLPLVLELHETSPLHFLQPVQTLFDQIFPSLLNGQFRLLLKDGQPASFVNWAWLSAEASERYSKEYNLLRPDEWQSGPELWFCEIVAKEGMMHTLMLDLQRHVFPQGATGRWRRIGPSGELKGIGMARIPRLNSAPA